MIKSFIIYLKKKQILYYGMLATNCIENIQLRAIAKLLFSSGLAIDEIKCLKWKKLTIIKNVLLINNKEQTRVAIASDYFVEDLLKLKHNNKNVFSSYANSEEKTIIEDINKELEIHSNELHLDMKLNCEWLQKNFKNTIYIPKTSKQYFEKHILNKELIHENNIDNEKFNAILEIKSLI